MKKFTKTEAITLAAAIIDNIKSDEAIAKLWEKNHGKDWDRATAEIVANAFGVHYTCTVGFANETTTSPRFWNGAEKYSAELRNGTAMQQWNRKVSNMLNGGASKAPQPIDVVQTVIKYLDGKKLTKAQKALVRAHLA